MVFMLKLTVMVAAAEVPVRLAPPLADGSRARTKFISRHGKLFHPIALKLSSWSDLSRLASNPSSL